jgi:hypothetical protein
MNKTTIYREQILYYLNRNEDYRAMLVWIEEQPDLDQPDIFRELTAILKDRHEKTGEKEWLDKANIIEEGLEQFEEDILDEKLDKALFMMQFDNVEFTPEKVHLFFLEARKIIIKGIISDPEDNKELWNLARKIIKVKKNSGTYDPANWIKIFP